MFSPSSKTWRPSGPKPRPPTSAMWEVAANSATHLLPLRNTGVTTVKSFRWPVPCQGSLVSSTSPGCRLSTGWRCRKKPTLAAIALTWPGRAGHRLGQHPPAPVEHAGRQVTRLAHRGGKSRPHQRLRLFLDHGQQAVPDDLGLDRHPGLSDQSSAISFRVSTIPPNASISARQAAGTTVVVCSSVIKAGPAITAPGDRSPRR